MEADGALFLRVLCNKVVQQFRVMRNANRVVRHVDHTSPCVVAAVAGQHNGNAQTRRFRDFLERIVFINQRFRRTIDVVQVRRHVIADDGVIHRNVAAAIRGGIRRFVRIEPFLRVGIHAGERAAGRGVPQQTDFLIQRHLAEQIVHARVHRLPPVFVHVQRAVAVQILELQSIDLDDVLHMRFQFNLPCRLIRRNDDFVHGIGFGEGMRINEFPASTVVKVLLFRSRDPAEQHCQRHHERQCP